MKQITDDYCSFEIAKLLKEKGFDGECRMTYREHDMQMIYYTPNPNNLLNFTTNREKLEKHSKKQHCDYALCPTHQMALKWLREVHKLHIYAEPYWPQGDMRNKMRWQGFVVDLNTINGDSQCYADSPEEAIENRIRFVLENLI